MNMKHMNIPFYPYIPPRGCPNIFPVPESLPTPPSPSPTILKADTLQYVAISDGVKRIYTNQDGLTEYGNTSILNPNSVSYMNLFINAMLQPPSLYKVQEGFLILTSRDIPMENVPIILQFILIYQS